MHYCIFIFIPSCACYIAGKHKDKQITVKRYALNVEKRTVKRTLQCYDAVERGLTEDFA